MKIINLTSDTKIYNNFILDPNEISSDLSEEQRIILADHNQFIIDLANSIVAVLDGLDQLSSNDGINAIKKVYSVNPKTSDGRDIVALTSSNKIKFDLMASNQSISTASYTTIYSYDGSGLLYSFECESSTADNYLELVLDSNVVITSNLNLIQIPYGNTGTSFIWHSINGKYLYCKLPYSIPFSSKIEIKLKAMNSNEKLKNGFVVLTKET
jgi:hypothetical protein